MMETMKSIRICRKNKSIVTPDELQRQLSNEPKVYFTEREFLHLFRRNNSVGIV